MFICAPQVLQLDRAQSGLIEQALVLKCGFWGLMARAQSQSTNQRLSSSEAKSENDGVGGKGSASPLLQHKQAFHPCCFPLFFCCLCFGRHSSSYREVAFCADLAPVFSTCAVEEFCASTFLLNVSVFPRSFTDLLSEYENISRAMCLTQNTAVVMAKKASFFFPYLPNPALCFHRNPQSSWLKLCSPKGDCNKCAISPLCMCVIWCKCYTFLFWRVLYFP